MQRHNAHYQCGEAIIRYGFHLPCGAVCSVGHFDQARAGCAMRAVAQMKPTISRAIAVVTTTFGLPPAARRRYRAHNRAWAFHAMSRITADRARVRRLDRSLRSSAFGEDL